MRSALITGANRSIGLETAKQLSTTNDINDGTEEGPW